MAELNKGITISFRGDTIEFDNSVDGINKAIKTLKKDTSALNKELKLDPTNADKLNQKLQNLSKTEELLTKNIENYRNELNGLGKIDTKDKEAEFKRISSAIQDCEKGLTSIKSQINSMNGNNVQSVADSFEDAGDEASIFGDVLGADILSSAIMSGLSTLVSLVQSLGSAFADAITNGVEYNAEMEKYTTGFTAMLGSGEQATELIARLRQNASSSPFDVASLVQSTQALLTTGESGEKAEKVIMALGDAIAYTGGGNSELTRMASNLQQVKNVGKATAMDIRQFAMAGIDIYGILAKSTGKSIAQIQEMDITYKQLTDALIKASSEGGKYYGAMTRQASTYSGQLNLLQSNWNEFTGGISSSVNELLASQVFPMLNDLMVTLQPILTEMVESLTTFVTEHLDDIKQFIEDVVGYITSQEFKDEINILIDLIVNKIPLLIENLNILGIKLSDIKGFLDVILVVATAVVDMLNKIFSFDLNGLFYGNSAWNKFTSLGGGSVSSGGFGQESAYSSGGFNTNVTINVTNSGSEISRQMVMSWADMITDRVNENLGNLI